MYKYVVLSSIIYLLLTRGGPQLVSEKACNDGRF